MSRRRSVGNGRGGFDRRYLEALARGDASAAARVVGDARRRGLTVEQIYLHLFVPAQVEVGARWRARRMSVADEHLASEITLAEMERLRERLPPSSVTGPHVILACVEGESHAIGLRMFADLLRIDRWVVDYLGSSLPTGDLVAFVGRRRPDLVALSITQAEHLPSLTLAAAGLRRLSPPPRVLAGGAAVQSRARAAAALGVDAVAPDARAGVQEARRLTTTGAESPAEGGDYFERLGRRVHDVRSERGLTQQELADEAGLDRTYISGLERGKQNPTIGALLRVARALEVPLDHLVVHRRDRP